MSEIVLDVDPWQLEIIQDEAREKVCMGGRGVGKTVGLARNWAIQTGLETLDGEFAYFSPTYAIAMRERRTIAKNRFLRPFIESSHDQPFPYILWRSGTQTYFRSTDREENLLGYHLNGACVDECHKVGERALDEIIRPQVGAKRGTLMLIGQHDDDGEEGWINKRFFLKGQDRTQKRVRSWRIPSSKGRMFQGKEGRAELEAIRQTTDEYTWRWQYLAEAVEAGNRAFRSEDVKHCIGGELEERAHDKQAYVIGYDLGKITDPSAYVVLRFVSRKEAVVVATGVRPLMERHEMQAVNLQRLSRVYGNCPVLVDTTGGASGGHGSTEPDPYVKYYRDQVPTMRAFFINQTSKQNIVQSLQLAVEQKRLRIPAGCDVLSKQLRQFRWERKGGRLDFHGPNGHEDDLVMALAMAWCAVERGWVGQDGTSSIGDLL